MDQSPFELWLADRLARRVLEKARDSSPVLIVGMHRSGTSLVSRIVEAAGVFLGCSKSGNNESHFFQRINRQILDVIGCNWRHIESLPQPEDLQAGVSWARRLAAQHLERGLARHFFGYRSARFVSTEGFRWGWKDPRTSLLLPVWRHFFPAGRVVHITRDSRDVALSLIERDTRRLSAIPESDRERRFQEYCALRGRYLERIEAAAELFPCYRMQYEGLIADPGDQIEKLLAFLDLDSPPGRNLIGMVDTNKGLGTAGHRQGSA
jgi:hypothetical protein